MHTRYYGFVIATGAVAACSTSAFAGVVITSIRANLDTKQSNSATIYVESDRLKVATPETTMIFRGDQNKVWVIRGEAKTYSELTPEMMRGMGGQMAGASSQLGAAQAQMQARLAQLPPEQRAMIEAQMAGRGGPGGPQGAGGPQGGGQVSYAGSGQSKTVANWRCQVFAKTVGGQKEEDVCIAPIASAGLTAADFQVLDSFSSFMAPVLTSPMAPHNDYMSWKDMNKATGFQGFPLETIVYLRGKPSIQETVQKIEHTAIPPGTFELPPGMTKQNGPPR